MTCGVFASIFVLVASVFVLCLCVCSAFILLSLPLSSLLLLSFVSLWVVLVVFFSLTDYTQKERACRVGASSLRVLLAFSLVGLIVSRWMLVFR